MVKTDRRLGGALVGGAALAVVLNADPAGAHTGHGTEGLSSGLTHPLLGVDHLVAMIAVAVLAVLISRRWVAPAAFLGGMALGGGVALAGVELPFVETLIILSVVALGAALIAGRATWWIPAVVLVGVAGLFHGHAHGVEAPTGANPAAFVAAFLLATATLHAIGVGAGVALAHVQRQSQPDRRFRVSSASATMRSTSSATVGRSSTTPMP
jgi:urease accessory protein